MRSVRVSNRSNWSSNSYLYNNTENQVHLLTHVDIESAEYLSSKLFDKYTPTGHSLSDSSIRNLIHKANPRAEITEEDIQEWKKTNGTSREQFMEKCMKYICGPGGTGVNLLGTTKPKHKLINLLNSDQSDYTGDEF